MKTSTNKHGYKSDICECVAGDIQGLLDTPMVLTVAATGTVYYTRMKGAPPLRHKGYTTSPRISVFVDKTKDKDKDSPEQRAAKAKVRAELQAKLPATAFLRDLMGADAPMVVKTSNPTTNERFSSAGGVLRLEHTGKGALAGRPSSVQVRIAFPGSRDWPDQRPAGDAPEAPAS